MPITIDKRKEGFYFLLIGILSIAIPISMAIVLFSSPVLQLDEKWVERLPWFKAILNLIVFVFLIAGVVAIKFKKYYLHRSLMLGCFWLIFLFLIAYVVYYLSYDISLFGDLNNDKIVTQDEKIKVGTTRLWYFIIYVTHILSGIFLVPLIFLTFYFSLSNQISRHIKIVRWTLPLWLYVSGSYLVAFWIMHLTF